MKAVSRIHCMLLAWRIFVQSTMLVAVQGRNTNQAPRPNPPVPSPPTSNLPSANPPRTNVTSGSITTIFYTHGDVPYTASQAVKMKAQMLAVPSDAEFVVFLGDLRAAGPTCPRSDYERASNISKLSRAPVFALIGDNDWTDCPNRAEGHSLWNEYFLNFDIRYWKHNFNVQRQSGRPENFSFQHKGSLFIGLNIVGGVPSSSHVNEWNTRLTDEVNWTINLVRSYKSSMTGTGRVVIFGHANPNSSHDPFFKPLATFIKNELQNKIPIMYINGDQHQWMYTTNFYNQVSFQRITVTGLAVDPLLKINVIANGQFLATDKAITYDRRLSAPVRS